MGLQREPFQRVYSAPEPPSPSRRPKLLALVVALVAFAGAAVAVWVLMPGGGKDAASPGAASSRASASSGPSAAPPGERQPSGSPSESPSGSPEPSGSAAGAELIASLPKPCAMVSERTVRKTTPKATRAESSNASFTTCTYTSGGPPFRWLRVELTLYPPAGSATPVRDAEREFGVSWSDAHNARLVRTISLRRQGGIGDEAFRWFKADDGQPTVVGQVTTRLRNVLVTVSYSEQAGKGRADAREGACIGAAEGVTREVLRTLTHF